MKDFLELEDEHDRTLVVALHERSRELPARLPSIAETPAGASRHPLRFHGGRYCTRQHVTRADLYHGDDPSRATSIVTD